MQVQQWPSFQVQPNLWSTSQPTLIAQNGNVYVRGKYIEFIVSRVVRYLQHETDFLPILTFCLSVKKKDYRLIYLESISIFDFSFSLTLKTSNRHYKYQIIIKNFISK